MKLSDDGMSAELTVEDMAADTVVHFSYKDLKGSEGESPVFHDAWYTLNKLKK